MRLKEILEPRIREVWGVPIPSTARPQGLKKVTKKSYGKISFRCYSFVWVRTIS